MSIDGEEGLGALVEAIGADRAMIAAGLLRESIDNVESLCSTLGDDCGFRRMDCLRYTEKAENAADIRREYSLRMHNGIDAELLDPNEASRQFTFPIEAGVYSKGTAAQADPSAWFMPSLPLPNSTAHAFLRTPACTQLRKKPTALKTKNPSPFPAAPAIPYMPIM